MVKRILKEREGYPGTFEFFKDKEVVASITLYGEGLIEFSGKHKSVAIESVGDKDEQIVINQLQIK